MGREVRRVPPDWQHPKDKDGQHIPLRGTFRERREELAQWERGFVSDYRGGWEPKEKRHMKMSAEEYFGSSDPKDFMPDWPDEACTHYQMYENTTEGTPISPVIPTPEALARWLADTKASAFGNDTASYDNWLSTIHRGSAPSAILVGDGPLISGVEGLGDEKP